MKIGFDAKWYFEGPPSGRRIVRGLVSGLARKIGDDELHVFLDADYAGRADEIDIPRERQHYVWARNNQLANLVGVPRVADKCGMDVVAYQNFVPPRVAARHARVAFVHDVIFQETPRYYTAVERLYFSTVRPLTAGADRACTVSHSEKSRMVRLGFGDAERIDVVPYGVDDVFKARGDHRARDAARVLNELGVRRPFVLSVSRLTVRKNVATLVRAMQHVRTEPLDLVVVGAADRTCEDLPALAQRLGIASRVHFVGPMQDDRLPALYGAASAFCFPTLDESYGLPPLEAMACGTPCVVSDIGVLREMYGDAAVFVDSKDERAIATAIDSLLADQARIADLQRKGERRAGEFTWDRAAELLIGSARAAATSRA